MAQVGEVPHTLHKLYNNARRKEWPNIKIESPVDSNVVLLLCITNKSQINGSLCSLNVVVLLKVKKIFYIQQIFTL